MKTLKKFYQWTLIIVILQIAVLVFLNYVYFNFNGLTSIKPVNASAKKTASAKTQTIALPAGATDIKISFDGKYAGYNVNGSLEIYDVAGKKAISTVNVDGSSGLSHFEWLHDRDIVIYSFNAPDDKTGQVLVTTYNVTDATFHNYGMEEPGTYVISGFPTGTHAVDFELSPLTNVLYVKLLYNESNISVARYDIQDNLSYVVYDSPENVFKCTYLNDNLLYFDYSGHLSIRNGVYGTYRYLNFPENSVLLGSTYDDTVFIGEKDGNGNVFKITKFFLDTSGASDQSDINLPVSVPASDIIFYFNSHLYIVDRTGSKVYDITNNKQIPYSNDFVEITQTHIVTKSGNKLTLEKL